MGVAGTLAFAGGGGGGFHCAVLCVGSVVCTVGGGAGGGCITGGVSGGCITGGCITGGGVCVVCNVAFAVAVAVGVTVMSKVLLLAFGGLSGVGIGLLTVLRIRSVGGFVFVLAFISCISAVAMALACVLSGWIWNVGGCWELYWYGIGWLVKIPAGGCGDVK